VIGGSKSSTPTSTIIMTIVVLSFIPLAAWLYLLLGRGWFWLCRDRDDLAAAGETHSAHSMLASVVVVIPARDEAEFIAQTVSSLLRQDYLGSLSIIVVDDQSADDTSGAALSAARAAGRGDALQIIAGRDLPSGWTGKLWAMRQGLAAAESRANPPEFILFADADIVFAPHVVRGLIAIQRAKGSVLTSLMVKLRCHSRAEHWLTPAFVFFFQMLYPFAWAKDPRRRTAAAAGGCMLARRATLAAAGGLESLRGALIDDCALAAAMKKQGPIWLGLTDSALSMRPYPTFGDFGRMVSRSAYTELRYSPLRLGGAVIGMALVYLAPPLLTIFARGASQAAGAFAWALMGAAFAPMMRFYRRPVAGALALPAIAAAYVAFTIASAIHYWRGQGGHWKGRVQAQTWRDAALDAASKELT
jgi:hopene-associated glycosyltransferase HpnB